MSSFLDTLTSFLKSAHPDATDEDIKAHIDSLKATPEMVKSAMTPLMPQADPSSSPDAPPQTQSAPTPDITGTPNMSMKIPSANSTPSNFDVGVSDNTVTQNGSAPSVTAQPGDVPPPVPPTPDMQPMNAPPSAPAAATPTPAPTDVTAPTKGGPAAPDPLKAALTPDSNDEDAEDALKKKNQNLKMVGAISGAVGSIGDAIGNAAVPFGGKGSSGTQERINENINEQVDKNKANLEDELKKDPTSDISRHYQKVLGLMLGAHAKGMNIDQMSAEQIATTLPEVEKYMQKELGMTQIKSNKDLQMSIHEQGRQDKLEKDAREWVDNLSKARNGEIGVQNGKVDQARHLLQLFKQSEDTGQPLSNSQYGELAIGAANLVAGGAQNVSDHTRQMIMQSTAEGDLNKALTYAGFSPTTLGGSTNSVLKNLKETVIRQGMEAENQRDKFINDQKKFIPSGLDPAKAQKLVDANFGNSIKEFLPKPKAALPNAGAVPVVTDQQTYDRLPSGASYQDANGKTYRKK